MSEEMFISFIFPSRQRPEKFYTAIDNICSLCASKRFEIVCVLDFDDIMYQHDNLIKIQSLPENVHCYFGNSTGKIHSCNRELDKISDEAQIICLHSDDFLITKYGFDNDIREAAKNFHGLIHFPDTFQNQNLCTYPILTKSYLGIDGWIYHPKFTSLYSDNFQTELAKKRGMYKFVNKQVISHNHWRNGKAEKDELYLRNDCNEMYIKDNEVYLELKKEYEL